MTPPVDHKARNLELITGKKDLAPPAEHEPAAQDKTSTSAVVDVIKPNSDRGWRGVNREAKISRTLANLLPPDQRPQGQIDEFVIYTAGNRKGEIVTKSQANVQLALRQLGVSLRYNAFAAKALVTWNGRTQPLDDAIIDRAWFLIDETFHFQPEKRWFVDLINDLARRDSFHPVHDYLHGLTWDRQPRVDGWLSIYGGAQDTAFIRHAGALFLIAAVRRVLTPGCKFDELPVLESIQGKFKSMALRALCPDDSWFSDDLPLGVDAKQIIERTSGKWIIEASEMQGYTHSEVDRLKGMLSRQVDGPVRLAYGRIPTEVPRQFVMCGTTNKLTEYLRDSTGNRRFWPIQIEQFDVDALTRDRDQLWAEAAVIEASGMSTRLPSHLWAQAAVEQDARRRVDPWEELIVEQVDLDRDVVPVADLWHALGEAGNQRKVNDADRLTEIMQRQGFTRKVKTRHEKGKPVTVWIRPSVDVGQIVVRQPLAEPPDTMF